MPSSSIGYFCLFVRTVQNALSSSLTALVAVQLGAPHLHIGDAWSALLTRRTGVLGAV